MTACASVQTSSRDTSDEPHPLFWTHSGEVRENIHLFVAESQWTIEKETPDTFQLQSIRKGVVSTMYIRMVESTSPAGEPRTALYIQGSNQTGFGRNAVVEHIRSVVRFLQQRLPLPPSRGLFEMDEVIDVMPD